MFLKHEEKTEGKSFILVNIIRLSLFNLKSS